MLGPSSTFRCVSALRFKFSQLSLRISTVGSVHLAARPADPSDLSQVAPRMGPRLTSAVRARLSSPTPSVGTNLFSLLNCEAGPMSRRTAICASESITPPHRQRQLHVVVSTLITIGKVMEAGRYIPHLQIASPPQLVNYIFRNILRPALDGVDAITRFGFLYSPLSKSWMTVSRSVTSPSASRQTAPSRPKLSFTKYTVSSSPLGQSTASRSTYA